MDININNSIIDYIMILLPSIIGAAIALVSARLTSRNPQRRQIMEAQLRHVYLPLYKALKCDAIEIETDIRVRNIFVNMGIRLRQSELPALSELEITRLRSRIDNITQRHILLVPQNLQKVLMELPLHVNSGDSMHRSAILGIMVNYNVIKRYLGYPCHHSYLSLTYMSHENRIRSILDKSVYIFVGILLISPLAILLAAHQEGDTIWVILLRIEAMLFLVFMAYLVVCARISFALRSKEKKVAID